MSSQLLRPEYQRPGGVAFGPVFTLTKDVPVNDLLKGAGVHKLRSGTVYPDRHHPNFFRSKTPTARSSDIRELTELVRQKVESVYAVSLVSRHEYLGVW
jgi:UDP-N-acetylenolpyruvoylglucosamine reductase